ncbi:hypothetical protein KWR14_005790 [Clostridioides difficile]|nr:hypothetical protein [uncultured Clostridioides sp.]EGT5422324.1 hypothetical protein [Clostridioides difficile]MBH7487381.1 hypothetical protein [Clostridioides difficile]MBY1671774.1 hypothetical protein [Clostridioides difficile]MBY1793848.1 hypothetical protein [Clostridioides difficile]MBY1996652.1 hypothetical protein [Clostridioides difficile]
MTLSNMYKIVELARLIIKAYEVDDIEAIRMSIKYLEDKEINGMINDKEYDKLLSLIKDEERELTIWKRE